MPVVRKPPINADCGEPYNECHHAFCDSRPHRGEPITYAYAWNEFTYSRNDAYLKKCELCDGCIWCCACWFCNSCKTKYRHNALEKRCMSCMSCSKCCSCVKCTWPGCPQRVPASKAHQYFCEHGYCSKHQVDCCKPVVHYLAQGELYFWTAKLNQHKMNPTDRFLAAEIEVARLAKSNELIINLMSELRGGVVEDQSLAKNTSFEITTAPANGDLWVDHITRICDLLAELKARVDERCGLHIHLDARDYSIFDLRRLIFLYERLEPALFNMVTVDRVTHHNMAGQPYSGPCGLKYAAALRTVKNSRDTRRTLLETIYGTKLSRIEADMEAMAATERDYLSKLEAAARERGYSGKRLQTYIDKAKAVQHEAFERVAGLNQLKHTKRSNARYAAVNFHSYFFHNTVEVRMHHGTVKAADITQWGMLWAEIMDWALKHKEEEINEFPAVHMCTDRCMHFGSLQNKRETSLRILKTVVPEYLHKFIDYRVDLYNANGGFFLGL